MRPGLIVRSTERRRGERGVTMVLVALAMVAIIAMAALSIDIITLYLAREEAQRTADAAALTAARILSISGITGDPANSTSNWSAVCGGSTSPATQAAQAVVQQNAVGNAAIPTSAITVSYSGGSGGSITSKADCSQLATTAFGVNPMVTVRIQQTALPTFFSRIWGKAANTVSATATAEAFNPSNSGNVGNQTSGTITPVQPRCVKPWAVPNQDPLHNTSGGVGICTGGATGTCAKIVNLSTGQIVNPGISLSGSGSGGIIGERFWLNPDCRWSQSSCVTRITTPQANYNNGSGYMKGPPGSPNLVFAPAEVGTTTPTAVPSCATGDEIQEAIGGCDSPQNYSCGVAPPSGTNAVDLSDYPDASIANGVSCLIHQTDTTDLTKSSGQDYLNSFGAPSTYPFQVLAGSSNPLVTSAGLAKDSPISTSPSIVSLPIYDETTSITQGNANNPVTFVGFLQVFINAVDQYGNINVTVLNVTGCSNTATPGTAVAGSSPVPVRLITPP
jgi:Flp pilus assembly protein TadG